MRLSQSAADTLGSILGIGVIIAICIWSCGCSTPRRAVPDDVRWVVPCGLTTLERDDAYLSLPPYSLTASIDTMPDVVLLIKCNHETIWHREELVGMSLVNWRMCEDCGKQWIDGKEDEIPSMELLVTPGTYEIEPKETCTHSGAIMTTLMYCIPPDSQCNTCTCVNCGKKWKC